MHAEYRNPPVGDSLGTHTKSQAGSAVTASTTDGGDHEGVGNPESVLIGS
jgi:hypothetical protein